MQPGLEKTESGRFALSGMLTFESVNHLRENCGDLFAGSADVLIDLSGVENSDSAGLALLVEWMSEAQRRNQAIRFANIPAQMLAIARVSSLDEVLPLVR